MIRDGRVEAAAEIIRAGGLAAVPTETVYGLAANGLDGAAVEKLYEVKGRPGSKPISLLVSGMEQAEALCRDIPEDAYTLARAFFPGPLTMILYKSGLVPSVVTAGGDTVGIRCPAAPLTLELIRLAGVPLAAPSANPSGAPSPKDIETVLAYFDGRIECAIDGGPCAVGVESTIVDMTQKPYRIRRAGGLSGAEIKRKTGIRTVR
ncbi:MAG: threonylcarbamoyl-AMP synthase [Oscillospiraceae bacterium]|nr:threonylcarbamoyl-AMP synthase [Oscillospiraceae bacterium]